MNGDDGTVSSISNVSGFDPGFDLGNYLARTMQFESGGNPSAVTGSNTGLYQFGPSERAQYGITSSNWQDPDVQRNAMLQETQNNAIALSKSIGRPVTGADLYLAHQQGLGGASAHLNNPDAPAWQNMASTAEGRQKGDGWARQAIWGNIPDNPKTSPLFNKTMFPNGVESVTSRDFTNGWASKYNQSPTQVAFGSGGTGPIATGGGGVAPGAVASAMPVAAPAAGGTTSSDTQMAQALSGAGKVAQPQEQQLHGSPFSPFSLNLAQAIRARQQQAAQAMPMNMSDQIRQRLAAIIGQQGQGQG